MKFVPILVPNFTTMFNVFKALYISINKPYYAAFTWES